MLLAELRVVERAPHVREREERLDPGRAARDEREGPGRRDGRDGRVPAWRAAGAGQRARREPRERAALARERLARGVRLALHEAHQLVGGRERLGRVVRDPEPDEQVRPAHHAEPDLAVPVRDLRDLRERPDVHVEHVVEEPHAVAHAGAERVPVDSAGPLEAAEVHGAERAGLERQERLLAARVHRLEVPEVRRRVGRLDAIEEHEPGLPARPRRLARSGRGARARRSSERRRRCAGV